MWTQRRFTCVWLERQGTLTRVNGRWRAQCEWALTRRWLVIANGHMGHSRGSLIGQFEFADGKDGLKVSLSSSLQKSSTRTVLYMRVTKCDVTLRCDCMWPIVVQLYQWRIHGEGLKQHTHDPCIATRLLILTELIDEWSRLQKLT